MSISQEKDKTVYEKNTRGKFRKIAAPWKKRRRRISNLASLNAQIWLVRPSVRRERMTKREGKWGAGGWGWMEMEETQAAFLSQVSKFQRGPAVCHKSYKFSENLSPFGTNLCHCNRTVKWKDQNWYKFYLFGLSFGTRKMVKNPRNPSASAKFVCCAESALLFLVIAPSPPPLPPPVPPFVHGMG